jgi:hypothetical protein
VTICKERSHKFKSIEDDNLREKMAWIQEDTKRDYSQIGYGKTTLVVDDGGDGENPRAMRIQEGGRQRLAMEDGVESRFRRRERGTKRRDKSLPAFPNPSRRRPVRLFFYRTPDPNL